MVECCVCMWFVWKAENSETWPEKSIEYLTVSICLLILLHEYLCSMCSTRTKRKNVVSSVEFVVFLIKSSYHTSIFYAWTSVRIFSLSHFSWTGITALSSNARASLVKKRVLLSAPRVRYQKCITCSAQFIYPFCWLLISI